MNPPRGGTADPDRASSLISAAAALGDPDAQMLVAGIGTATDEAEALARLALAERRGVAGARRYRRALQQRVPPAQARQAAARIAGDAARGPVPAVDRPLVRFAQSVRAHRGAWARPVDGRDGPQIRAALADFARGQGLAVAQPYDPVVIDRLRDLAG